MSKCDELQAKAEQAEKFRQMVLKENEELTAKVKELESELETHKQLEDMEGQPLLSYITKIADLTAKVKIEQDVAISLGEQLTEATARLEEAKKEIQRLKDHIFMCKTDQYKKLMDELEEAKKEIEKWRKLWKEVWDTSTAQEEHISELQKQNTLLHDMLNASEKCIVLANDEIARLKEALECVYVWLANSQDHVKCKNNPFPDGIVKEVLQQLSNQGVMKIETDGFVGRRISENELSNQGESK
jgi:chromosome segregation ATPase